MTADTDRGGTVRILDADDPADRRQLDRLRADPRVDELDELAQQRAGLGALVPPPGGDILAEPARWVYYPWRRVLVALLGPRAFRRLRLDRNRHKILEAEQHRLGGLKIGVIGSSAGYAVAQMLALEGLCGELRLADFDHLELSNLNRVAASVFDLGVNKAIAASRRIAEIDPYLTVRVFPEGLTGTSIGAVIDGLDILIEECDSLEMKVLAREYARSRGIPVLMATSDRGLLDVERFDLEPARPLLHGLLGDLDSGRLAGLSTAQKVPHVLRILEAGQLSARAAASLLEVGHTIGTWPQLAGDVAMGAVAIAAAVIRIGLGTHLPSGRVRIDVDEALDSVCEPPGAVGGPAGDPVAAAEDPAADASGLGDPPTPRTALDAVIFASAGAPSGGNAQPWHIDARRDRLVLRLDTNSSTTMDLHYRGSAVALGAALYNARVAAAAQGILGPVTITDFATPHELQARLVFDGEQDARLASHYRPMLRRETNRNIGQPSVLAPETVSELHSAAREHGARLHLVTAQGDIDRAADVLAAADRVRYLTPRLHAEMVSELRWPGSRQSPDTGIDVRSLGVDPTVLITLDVIRRADVMAELAAWNAGGALGEDTRTRVRSSSALAIVTGPGHSLADYVRAGVAVEALWIRAQQDGLAVHPVSPVFLYARTEDDLRELSAERAGELDQLQRRLHTVAGLRPGEPIALVLRLSHDAKDTEIRSRRAPPPIGDPHGSQP